MEYIVTGEFIPSMFDRTPTIKPGYTLIQSEDDPDKWTVLDRRGERIASIPDAMVRKIKRRKAGETLMQAIGKQIRRARIAKGLTQDQVGQTIRASRNYVNMVEMGRANASLEKIQQFCDAIGHTITFKITRKYGDNNDTATKTPDRLQ